MGFAATLVYPPATTSCQVLVAFAAAFDQLARIAIEQFLLWGMKSGQKASSGTCILQALVLLRFILGGVLVGVQRPQFRPACVASNLLLPLGIAALATDALIVFMLLLQLTAAGLLLKERRATPGFARIKSLFLTTSGFGVWTAVRPSAYKPVFFIRPTNFFQDEHSDDSWLDVICAGCSNRSSCRWAAYSPRYPTLPWCWSPLELAR